MAADINLTWQWPGDRKPSQKINVKIDSIEKYKGGFFGVQNSPSLIKSLPDPVRLKGQVVEGNADLLGKSVELILPKLESHAAAANDVVTLGVVDAGTVCITLETKSATKNPP
jgi:hypothetical protein